MKRTYFNLHLNVGKKKLCLASKTSGLQCCHKNRSIGILTDMYERVPTNEFAIESINWPLTPKSHILISPFELTNILEGFTSERQIENEV